MTKIIIKALPSIPSESHHRKTRGDPVNKNGEGLEVEGIKKEWICLQKTPMGHTEHFTAPGGGFLPPPGW